jgi:hypothetical protein
LIWITAGHFGVGPGRGEYIAAFGTAGPALAAIFLSRRGHDTVGEPSRFRAALAFRLDDVYR